MSPDPFTELCRRLHETQQRQARRPAARPPAAARAPFARTDLGEVRRTLAKASADTADLMQRAAGGFVIGQGVRVAGVDGGFRVVTPLPDGRVMLIRAAAAGDAKPVRLPWEAGEMDRFAAAAGDLVAAPEFDAPPGLVATPEQTARIGEAAASLRATRERVRKRLAAAHAAIARDVEARRITALEASHRVAELNLKARKLGL